MAPARMVAFMEKHISQCEECLADPDVRQETEKIREIVLPPSKIPKPKVARASNEEIEEDAEELEEEATSEDADEEEDQDEDVADEDEVDEDYDPDLMDDDDAI